jgi:SRSO17 transposase
MGLVMPCERNSVEPIVAVTAPAGVGAQHQSMLHFVGEASWSDELVLAEVRDLVLRRSSAMSRPRRRSSSKQGQHLVGVARQYCGATASGPPLWLAPRACRQGEDESPSAEIKPFKREDRLNCK